MLNFTVVVVVTVIAWGSVYHLIIQLFYLIWLTKNEKTSQYFVFLFFCMQQTLKTGVYFPIFNAKTENIINKETKTKRRIVVPDCYTISAVWPHIYNDHDFY